MIDLALLLAGLAFTYWAGYRHAQRGHFWMDDPCSTCDCEDECKDMAHG